MKKLLKKIWELITFWKERKKEKEDGPVEELPPGIDNSKKISGRFNWNELVQTIRATGRISGGRVEWTYEGETPVQRGWKGYHGATCGWYCPNATNPVTGEEEAVFCGFTEWIIFGHNDLFQLVRNVFKSLRSNGKTIFGGDYKYYVGESGKEYYMFVSSDNQSSQANCKERTNFFKVVHP